MQKSGEIWCEWIWNLISLKAIKLDIENYFKSKMCIKPSSRRLACKSIVMTNIIFFYIMFNSSSKQMKGVVKRFIVERKNILMNHLYDLPTWDAAGGSCSNKPSIQHQEHEILKTLKKLSLPLSNPKICPKNFCQLLFITRSHLLACISERQASWWTSLERRMKWTAKNLGRRRIFNLIFFFSHSIHVRTLFTQ